MVMHGSTGDVAYHKALARALERIGAAELLPGGQGLSPTIVPVTDVNFDLDEWENDSDTADPGGTGGYAVFVVPTDEFWWLHTFNFTSSNTTINQLTRSDGGGGGAVFASFTASGSYVFNSDVGIALPPKWQLRVNVAAHTAENSSFAWTIRKRQQMTPAKLPA